MGSAFVGALLAVPVLRYVFYPLTARSDSEWSEVDLVAKLSSAEMPVHHTLDLKRRDGWRETESQPLIYIIKKGDKLSALSAVCPHLGCTVPWDADRKEFVCPCHGGTFSPDGKRLSGPPRRSIGIAANQDFWGKAVGEIPGVSPRCIEQGSHHLKEGEKASTDTKTEPASKPGASARLWTWLDQRTGVDRALRRSLDEPIPGGARLAYVFGSGLLFIFLSQVVTGVCLALYYVPDPATAHTTVAYIVKEVAAGSFLRSLHSYGSSAMIVVLALHFLQTFLYGSFKGKRQILWMSGCVLALLVLGMAFTGYILPWDQSAYSAGSVGTNLVGQIPLVGNGIRRLMRGGSSMGALTLSRFYILHILIIPAMIFSFVAGHIILFRKAGAAGPVAGDPVRPELATETFYPKQVLIDMSFVLLIMGALGMLAHFVPVTLGLAADPSNTTYVPRPEWYFLPMFQWLKYWEGWRTVIGVVVIPVLLGALVFSLPFLDRGSERRPWRRPIPVIGVLVVMLGAIWLGMTSRLEDWRDPAVATQLARQRREEDKYFQAPFQPYSAPAASGSASSAPVDATVAEGKSLFDSHGCSGCHGASGGGAKGPALTSIATKYDASRLTALLKAPAAGMKVGGMVPLTLDDAQFAALYAYLSSLGGAGVTSLTSATLTKPRSTAPAEKTAATTGTSSASTIGEHVFEAHHCSGCHGVGGVGTSRAPALTKLMGGMSAAALEKVLEHPTHAMQSGGMPAMTLTAHDMNDLVDYLRTLSAPASHARTTAPAEPSPAPTESASASASASPSSTSASTTGERVFKAHGCSGCHGVGGVGTSRAPALTKLEGTMNAAALKKVLEHPTHAMQSGGMPAITLSPQDMNDLVTYLRSLASVPATSARRPHESSLASTGDAAAGRAVYAHCALCHGATGKGDGRIGRVLGLKPTDFTTALPDDAEWLKVIEFGSRAAGKSDGMRGFAGDLTEQQIRDVLAYVKTLK